MTDQSNDITLAKPVLEMLTVANEYCHLLETAEDKSLENLLEVTYRILPLMYLKGSLMPDVEVAYPEANERFVTQENWEMIFTSLRMKFLDKDEFWLIDPLHINETEPLKASISEHLADIYQDMKDFILLFQKNTQAARENAVFEIKSLFASHWGYKITSVSNQIHYNIHDSEALKSSDETSYDFF